MQVTRVETPRRALKGSSLVIDVVVTQTGYAGTKVPLIVEDDGRMVGTQDITLPARRRSGNGAGAVQGVRRRAADDSSSGFRVQARKKSRRTISGTRSSTSTTAARRSCISKASRGPKPKFIRQATEKDDNLQVVLLQRTAEATVSVPDKFLRLGVDSGEELQNGFPATREELFGYRGIILGSIEAAAFTPDQQRMLEDFVDVRGGSLLVLGGGRSFSEGGWAGTPLSDALPVVLDPAIARTAVPAGRAHVRPTRLGAAHILPRRSPTRPTTRRRSGAICRR